LRKAQQEVATFHRFQELCGKIIEVSEKLCALRPVGVVSTKANRIGFLSEEPSCRRHA
jgi:hypothetical protein